MITICLNMIVKNEAKIIKRLLDSCYKIIDYWVIVDTGSTDNTKEIIQKYFKEKNIKGELHEKEFVNFGYNRTYALTLAKNKADYLFFMDADHILNYDESFSKEQLKGYDEINIQLKTGILKYYLIRFLKADMDIKSVGVTHEYYEYNKKNPKIGKFKNIWIDDFGDGGCRHLKFERDIKLLRESIDNNPNNARDIFYLAESYRNSNNYEKAIEIYKKRVKMDYFLEEKWFSMYMIAKCYSLLEIEDKMISWCLKAFDERSTRSEPMYLLSEYYQKKCKYALSNIFCDAGTNIKYPEDDLLFIEEDVYRYKFSYIKGVIYHYLDKNASYDLNKAILLYNIPKNYYVNMLNNIIFYSKSLINELSLNYDKINFSFNRVEQSILNKDKQFFIVDNLNPFELKKYNILDGTFNIVKKYNKYNISFFNLCTHFINIDDEYFTVIYYQHKNNRLYKFIGLDSNLNLKYITDCFYLQQSNNEAIYEFRYENNNSISIYWLKDDKTSFKTNIRKKIFNNYLKQYIL